MGFFRGYGLVLRTDVTSLGGGGQGSRVLGSCRSAISFPVPTPKLSTMKSIKRVIGRIVIPPLIHLLRRRGYHVVPRGVRHYDQDGLSTVHNHDFMRESAFRGAYAKGVEASDGFDPRLHWRLHVALWVSSVACRLPGDFVECGVNKAFASSAIMDFLNWNRLGKTFYLLDTFAGPVEALYSKSERELGKVAAFHSALERGSYNCDPDATQRHFSQWNDVKIIPGAVPDTLSLVDSDQVAYLHLDMNCAEPEAAAAEFFWPKLVDNGLILLDDYAYVDCEPEKEALDLFADSKRVKVLSLPTGQGLIIKPPR